jgi:hypothetical protein
MMSASATVVAAMPMQGPLTKQIRIFGNLIKALTSVHAGSLTCSPRLSDEESSSNDGVKSLPELK